MLSHTATATFIRHYIEMVVVMFAGMIVLGLPGEAALHAIGSATSELRETARASVFLGMAFTMTVPMVAWMRYRGHRWQPTLEMAASMIIPTLAAIALLGVGAASFGALMGLEHVAMLLGMLVAMLLGAWTSTRVTTITATTRSPADHDLSDPLPRGPVSAGARCVLGPRRRSGRRRQAPAQPGRARRVPPRCTRRRP
jgi:hypothetical protein